MSEVLPRSAGFLFCVMGTFLSWLFGVMLRPPLLRGQLFSLSAGAWELLFTLLLPTFALTLMAMHWLPKGWRIPLGVIYTVALLDGLAAA